MPRYILEITRGSRRLALTLQARSAWAALAVVMAAQPGADVRCRGRADDAG